MYRALIVTTFTLAASNAVLAQFANTTITESEFAWLLSGNLVSGTDGPPIEAGDEIGVFFGDRLIGAVAITASQAASQSYASLIIFGDNPNTNIVEGPVLNNPITFQYYDASTNTTLVGVRALNANGEAVNLTWQGGEVIPPFVPLPIEVRYQSAEFDLRIGGGSGDNNGGNNGGGNTPTGNPDVDGDGHITRKDAAMVLRVVIGAGRSLDDATIARADVDGNGTVSTDDAIAVYKAM